MTRLSLEMKSAPSHCSGEGHEQKDAGSALLLPDLGPGVNTPIDFTRGKTGGASLLTAALDYASRGWCVFPCSVDKRPFVKDWPNVATTDREQIKAWWAKWPGASIGCPTGPGLGAWVLDVDLPDGPATLAALEAKYGPLPATMEQKTGSGGRQLFFKWPEGREIRNTAGERGKLGADLDVRGAGGYVILPPSNHLSGGVYEWM